MGPNRAADRAAGAASTAGPLAAAPLRGPDQSADVRIVRSIVRSIPRLLSARCAVVGLLLAGSCLSAGSVGGPALGAPVAAGSQWQWPLQPQPAVVTAFAAPPAPWAAGHRGLDLAGSVGQPVLAVAAGRVSFAGQVAGRGVLVVDHGRLRSTYQPLLPVARRGDVVRAGELVGTLILAGSHCLPSPCLHLGARAGEAYVDPLSLLGGGAVRLLPLLGTGGGSIAEPGPLLTARAAPLALMPPWLMPRSIVEVLTDAQQ